LGSLPRGSVDNGMGDPELVALMNELQGCSNYKVVSNIVSTLNAKPEGLKSPVQFVSGDFKMLQYRRRIDGNDFYWLANNNTVAQECVVNVEGASGQAQIWNCETGEKTNIASTSGQLCLTFEPHEAYFLVFDTDSSEIDSPIMEIRENQELTGKYE